MTEKFPTESADPNARKEKLSAHKIRTEFAINMKIKMKMTRQLDMKR